MRLRCLPTLCLATFLLLVACAPVPYTGRSRLLLTSEQEEVAMGLQAYPELIKKYKVIPSGPQVDMVNRIMKKLAAEDPRNYDWEVKLLDAPDVANAWALPGGKMAVYTGLIPMTQNEAGLAAVMGHEMGHAIARHSGERMSQEMVQNAGLIMAAVTLEDQKYRNEIMAALGVGLEFGVTLPYSRAHEYEADEIGLILLVKAGYDPYESVRLWDRMAARARTEPIEFFSTHPNSSNRARRLESLIPGIVATYGKGQPK